MNYSSNLWKSYTNLNFQQDGHRHDVVDGMEGNRVLERPWPPVDIGQHHPHEKVGTEADHVGTEVGTGKDQPRQDQLGPEPARREEEVGQHPTEDQLLSHGGQGAGRDDKDDGGQLVMVKHLGDGGVVGGLCLVKEQHVQLAEEHHPNQQGQVPTGHQPQS